MTQLIPSWQQRLKDWLWSLRDDQGKQKIVMAMIAGILILLIILGYFVWNHYNSNTTASPTTITVGIDTNQPTDNIHRALDGLVVQPDQNNKLPIAVMIDNSIDARPQFGLQSAGVVYETLAEGGITRLMAIYTNYTSPDGQLSAIGPIRSARPYFVQLAEEYSAVYIHAGGSNEALQLVNLTTELVDSDALTAAAIYFYRNEFTQAPHNLLTSTHLLALQLRDKKLTDQHGVFTPWKFNFNETPAPASQEPATSISIPYSTEEYDVEYIYTPDKNNNGSYSRFNGGVAHTDALTDDQITVKNVVVQYVDVQPILDDSNRLQIDVIGHGRAQVFQGGRMTPATWTKTDAGTRTVFADEYGNEIQFLPGNTWIELIPTNSTIIYK